MDESEKALADRVKAARKQARYTQRQLADAAQVSLGVVNNFERYVTFPQPSNLRAILRAVSLDEADALGHETPKAAAAVDEETIPTCPQCGRTIWPETYELVFDILGAYMDTLDPAERKAFQRRITGPVHGQPG